MSPLLANKLDESVKCIPINLVRSTGPDGEAQREGVQILHLEKIFVGSCSFNFPPRLFDELWVWTIMCVTSRRNSLIGSTELTAREALCEHKFLQLLGIFVTFFLRNVYLLKFFF